MKTFALLLVLAPVQASVDFNKKPEVGQSETYSMTGKLEAEGGNADLAATIVKKITKVNVDGSTDVTLSYADRRMTMAGSVMSDSDTTKKLVLDPRGVPVGGDETLRGDVVKFLFLKPSGSMAVGASQNVSWKESATEKVNGTIQLNSVKDGLAKFTVRLRAPGPTKNSEVDFGATTYWDVATQTLQKADGAIVPREAKAQFRRFVFNVVKK